MKIPLQYNDIDNRIKRDSVYLGDSVYLTLDACNRFWVATYNGIHISNKICLEDEVMDALIDTVKRTREQRG